MNEKLRADYLNEDIFSEGGLRLESGYQYNRDLSFKKRYHYIVLTCRRYFENVINLFNQEIMQFEKEKRGQIRSIYFYRRKG